MPFKPYKPGDPIKAGDRVRLREATVHSIGSTNPVSTVIDGSLGRLNLIEPGSIAEIETPAPKPGDLVRRTGILGERAILRLIAVDGWAAWIAYGEDSGYETVALRNLEKVETE